MISRKLFQGIILIHFLITYSFSPGPLVTINSLSNCENGKGYKLFGPFWNQFPITYSFENNVPPLIIFETEKAFEIWDSLVVFNLFERNDTISNVIMKHTNSPKSTTIAYASTNLDDSGYYSNGSIVFNSRYKLSSQEFSCNIDFLNIDLQSVVLHEIGHILGLAHYSLYTVTMSDSGFQGSFRKTLAQGDIDGFYKLYGQINDQYKELTTEVDVL